MMALTGVVGLFALANLLADQIPLYVSASGLVLAAIVWASQRISAFLRIFIVMYALGYLLLAGGALLAALGLLPGFVAALMPPAFSATAAVAFAAIVYGASFIPVIRTITTLADPYFLTDTPSTTFGRPFAWLGRTEAQVGARLVALLVAINFIQVAMQIRFNVFYRDLFNSLQEKNIESFWFQIFGIFSPLAAVWIGIAVYEIFVDNTLTIRWRNWLTRRTTERWLADGTHYLIPLTGESTDNPDQRLQADVKSFIDTTMVLSIRLLSQAATLVSFVIILWGLSRDFVVPFTADTVLPGFLVWLVVAYALVGTWLTHLIGRPLIGLDFRQEKVEADFRFSLARLREYGEQIALMRGEKAELGRLSQSFTEIVANYLRILSRRMKLVTFTGSYSQLSVIFPYVLSAPSYFAGKITLGVFQQTASAFNQVQSAMSFFISSYQTLAAYKAVIDRLTTFHGAMARAEEAGHSAGIARGAGGGRDLSLADLRLALPDGRMLINVDAFTFSAGQSVLVTGPSGSGKSTLLRAISGIWPFGQGRVQVPPDSSVMLLPQRPYIPLGTLRAAIAYPGAAETFGDERVREALDAVRLGHLADELDVEDGWGQRLSGGEQQRLSLARALLAQPDWLFLDEATASLDEPMEAEMYGVISRLLPDTTIVSIGHRSTLVSLHDRQVQVRPGEGGAGLAERIVGHPSPAPAAE